MKAKKTKVYICKHFEYDYDDFDKYFICNSNKNDSCRCECRGKKYIMQFCPFFERGEVAGVWEIDKWEKQDAEQFKKELEEKKREEEIKERALYEHLKKKFER